MVSLKAQCGVISNDIFSYLGQGLIPYSLFTWITLCNTGNYPTCENFRQPEHFGCYDAPPQTVNVGHLMLLPALYNWCPCHKKKQHNCMCAEKIQIKPGVSLLDTKKRELRRNQIY